MKIVWQYKDNEPIKVEIDEFIKTQIVLCLYGWEELRKIQEEAK